MTKLTTIDTTKKGCNEEGSGGLPELSVRWSTELDSWVEENAPYRKVLVTQDRHTNRIKYTFMH